MLETENENLVGFRGHLKILGDMWNRDYFKMSRMGCILGEEAWAWNTKRNAPKYHAFFDRGALGNDITPPTVVGNNFTVSSMFLLDFWMDSCEITLERSLEIELWEED